MNGLGLQLRDELVVLRDAARLLWRHWPVLLVLYLLGMAGREIAIYLAVQGSGVDVWLGAALLPFAPLSLMVAVLLMLDAVGPSLWHGPVRQDKLTLLAGALVPFLAVYSAQGYLRADRNRFLNEAMADEYRNDSYIFDATTIQGRTIADVDTTTMIVVILAVLLLRRVLDWTGVTRSNVPARLFAAWLEVAWLTWLASMLLAEINGIQDWIEQRVFVDWVLDGWAWFLDLIGPLAGPVSTVAGWVGGLLTDLNALVVLPLAWLTTGAVVYGGTLTSRSLGVTAMSPRLTWSAQQLTRVQERVALLPQPLQGWLTSVSRAMFGRFTTLMGGLRTLAVGGVVPMVLFCLAFLVSRYAEAATAEIIRWALGPQAADDMVSFDAYVRIASTSVSLLLQVTLVAAAVDRLLVTARRLAAEPSGTSAAPTTP
ncbi:hypothetical protein MWU75_10640 [Ornithinimicrobium sp. F0845]|uniref:hypothetical protein n=1 Tax=Ornithinimicrobium sp. F0845 TaxID=2926412 RepID=UPI001FF1133D|nr:hypothetical protein [Ornithinimicrobium sp. F0845]MCK0112597.1 hypothetical protein [Ornithinimicrobium sp. F0845]